MNMLKEILEYNRFFIENKEYEEYTTSKEPKKKIVILTCMDTRLTLLLPKALNLKNGDAKIIKNAGASVMHTFGSILRSIVVAIYEFHTDEVFIIGHYGCGMNNLNADGILRKAIERGISQDVINTLYYAGIDLKAWLHGFDSVEDSVKESVEMIRNHPLVPKDVKIHGLIIDPQTGKLDVVIDGYENR